MSYEKTNWKTGDVITAEKLNKIEDGIYAGPITVVFTIAPNNDITANYTYGEIEALTLIYQTTGNVVIPIIGAQVNGDSSSSMYQETLTFIGRVSGSMGTYKYCFKGENYTYYVSNMGSVGREENS